MPFLNQFKSAIGSFKSLLKQQFTFPVDTRNKVAHPKSFSPGNTGMRGIHGEVLFFYEALRDNNDALATISKNSRYFY